MPAYLIHILQSFDMGIFGPMAVIYKQTLEKKLKPKAGYFIDKIDFLEYY